MNLKNITTKIILTFIILCLVSINLVRAVSGTYEDAMKVRRLLTMNAPDFQQTLPENPKSLAAEDEETIMLPVSRGFDQGRTGLCWAYATLNALETIYMVRNPEGLEVELSRRAMQYYQMEDRYRRSIKNVNTYISEGGVVLDAIRLIQSNGIVSFEDYYDITDPYGQANIRTMINNAGNFTEKIIAMHEGMNIFYTAPPIMTHIPGSPTIDNPDPIYVEAEVGDLARLVLADYMWQSYTPSETEVGFHDHPDPDARWENKSWYMPRSEFPGRIKQALEAGFPVIVSIENHGVMVYGADYDSDGLPVRYYIKDSYEDLLHFLDGIIAWGYYYIGNADMLHESFWEMTTVEIPEIPLPTTSAVTEDLETGDFRVDLS